MVQMRSNRPRNQSRGPRWFNRRPWRRRSQERCPAKVVNSRTSCAPHAALQRHDKGHPHHALNIHGSHMSHTSHSAVNRRRPRQPCVRASPLNIIRVAVMAMGGFSK
jgi:hypothetical protein